MIAALVPSAELAEALTRPDCADGPSCRSHRLEISFRYLSNTAFSILIPNISLPSTRLPNEIGSLACRVSADGPQRGSPWLVRRTKREGVITKVLKKVQEGKEETSAVPTIRLVGTAAQRPRSTRGLCRPKSCSCVTSILVTNNRLAHTSATKSAIDVREA